MKILRAGGTAVDAVEAAIKALENNEITNAGYGSNLSIDGIVECDATIVDHYGRSGACGAVPSKVSSSQSFGPIGLLTDDADVKNPISLAKKILETSTQTLTLRRVPPNFLVGEGAKLFAMEHGLTIVNNEELTSRNAKDRYHKWRVDLQRATKATSSPALPSIGQPAPPEGASLTERSKSEDRTLPLVKARKGLLRDHSSAILTGMWNEGQPDSPSSDSLPSNSSDMPTPTSTPKKASSPLSDANNGIQRRGSSSVVRRDSHPSTGSPAKRAKTSKDGRASVGREDSTCTPNGESVSDVATLDRVSDEAAPVDPSIGANHSATPHTSRIAATELTAEPNDADFDLITDTMGAIAIDKDGNIAAASSSGGIGMKHMGRTGPAALVGVGTAVIPYDLGAEKTVAAVTSGTGEHMATTMAAQRCAERLYHGTTQGRFNRDCPEDDPARIMQDFIEKDFMGHPGVRNQASARAIGVMAVEVTHEGIFMHWGHNTDSFALASFGSRDRAPHLCMSRLPKNAKVNIGARRVGETPYSG